MQGRGQPEWRESGQIPEQHQHQQQPPTPGKHVSFHESVKQRRPQFEYQQHRLTPYGPPPSGPPPGYSGEGRWVFQPGPPRSPAGSWSQRSEPEAPLYESPPQAEQQYYNGGSGPTPPPPVRQPFLPPVAPTSPGFVRVPEHEQKPWRPPRIPYRPIPPSPGRQQQDMDPSPKRQRLQQVTPSSSRDVEAEGPSSQEQNQSRDNSSLKVLANAAEQAGGQSKQQHQQTMTTSLHHAPISPSTPSVAHTRTPSWHSLKSPGGSSHARNPSWQLPWAPSPDQHLRQRRSRDFAPPPGGYGGGGGGYASRAGGPPEMIQAAPSWDSQGPPPPQVIEAIRSRSFEDSPPYRQHVRGNSAASFGHYGFYSPEGHTYNANIMGTPHRSLRPPPTDLPPPPPSYDPYGGSGGSVYDQQQPLPAYAAAAPNHVSPGNSYYEPDQPSLPPAPPPPPSSHQYQPYTYVQQPQQQKEVTVLKKKFSWKHYPVLEKFLIEHRSEYLKYSSMNYTAEQKKYNNWLTNQVLQLAAENNFEFDPQEFNFVGIRDRVRCYYKSYVQTMRKKGIDVLPRKQEGGTHLQDERQRELEPQQPQKESQGGHQEQDSAEAQAREVPAPAAKAQQEKDEGPSRAEAAEEGKEESRKEGSPEKAQGEGTKGLSTPSPPTKELETPSPPS